MKPLTALEALKIIDSFEQSDIVKTTDEDLKLKEQLKNFILQIHIESQTQKEVKICMSGNDYKEFIRFKTFCKFLETEI